MGGTVVLQLIACWWAQAGLRPTRPGGAGKGGQGTVLRQGSKDLNADQEFPWQPGSAPMGSPGTEEGEAWAT